jgi:hypothetical protein
MNKSDFNKGQMVFIKPSPYSRSTSTIEGIVDKVGRKYVTVILPSGTVRYDIKTGEENTQYDTSVLYLSREEIEQEEQAMILTSRIRDRLKYGRYLPYDQAKQIAEILGIEQ